MNYAVLSKLKALSLAPSELINFTKAHLNSVRLPGLTETIFYLSADPDTFYTLSFWYTLEAWEAADQQIRQGLIKFPAKGLTLLEQSKFRLMWEHRHMHLTPVASNIRLMKFPPDFPREKIEEMSQKSREQRNRVEGLAAVWVGESPGEEFVLLTRMDWVSMEAQQMFFNQSAVKETLVKLRAQGLQIEYASFNLQGLVLSVEEPDEKL